MHNSHNYLLIYSILWINYMATMSLEDISVYEIMGELLSPTLQKIVSELTHNQIQDIEKRIFIENLLHTNKPCWIEE